MSSHRSRPPRSILVTLPSPYARCRGMTLVEVIVAMLIMTMFLLGFLSTSLQSRRTTEASVIQSAATTLVYGLVEQMKMLDYKADMPTTTTDAAQIAYDAFPNATPKTAPYIDVRLNQDQRTLLQCVYNTDPEVFIAPTETPSTITASVLDPAMKNTIGPIALSTATGTQSQPLKLSVWVWVDNISDHATRINDVADGKCVTVVYAYEFRDGGGLKTVISREVFVRTPLIALR